MPASMRIAKRGSLSIPPTTASFLTAKSSVSMSVRPLMMQGRPVNISVLPTLLPAPTSSTAVFDPKRFANQTPQPQGPAGVNSR